MGSGLSVSLPAHNAPSLCSPSGVEVTVPRQCSPAPHPRCGERPAWLPHSAVQPCPSRCPSLPCTSCLGAIKLSCQPHPECPSSRSPLSPFSPVPSTRPEAGQAAASPALRAELTSPVLCTPLYVPHFVICCSHHYHPHHDCRMPVAPPVALDLSCPGLFFPHHLPNTSLGIIFHLSSLLERLFARDFKKCGWKGPLKVTSSRSFRMHVWCIQLCRFCPDPHPIMQTGTATMSHLAHSTLPALGRVGQPGDAGTYQCSLRTHISLIYFSYQ